MLALLSLLTLGITDASAGSMALEPQNRFHLGLSMVDGPSPVGASLGFDSRMTRLLSMDIGMFVSPFPIAEDYSREVESYGQNFHLRHGVYFMPGLRVPHPQPREWAWELFVRAGAGALWTANTDEAVAGSPMSVRPGAGGTAGVDAFARFGSYGVRAYGRGWVFGGSRTSPDEVFVLVRPQFGLEALFQW